MGEKFFTKDERTFPVLQGIKIKFGEILKKYQQ
jgi:hypothetical protein